LKESFTNAGNRSSAVLEKRSIGVSKATPRKWGDKRSISPGRSSSIYKSLVKIIEQVRAKNFTNNCSPQICPFAKRKRGNGLRHVI
jgi:hypothetical protein